jgi:hypothetical protein
MLYGSKPKKGIQHRMIDLGRSKVLSPMLAQLRKFSISTAQSMVNMIWPKSILDDLPDNKTLDE